MPDAGLVYFNGGFISVARCKLFYLDGCFVLDAGPFHFDSFSNSRCSGGILGTGCAGGKEFEH